MIARTVVGDLHEVGGEIGPLPKQGRLLLAPGVSQQQHREPGRSSAEHEGGPVRVRGPLPDRWREHRHLER